MTKLHSILIRSSSTSGSVAIDDGTNMLDIAAPFVRLEASPAGTHPFAAGTVTFTADAAPVTLTLDVHAG
jgi:hypothetical protein